MPKKLQAINLLLEAAIQHLAAAGEGMHKATTKEQTVTALNEVLVATSEVTHACGQKFRLLDEH